jgi:hypothetical protein
MYQGLKTQQQDVIYQMNFLPVPPPLAFRIYKAQASHTTDRRYPIDYISYRTSYNAYEIG